ncbi:MAG: VOC family protein [Alphaproteobacteria bacterium]|nr:VOC family protein [Alphaproteobacteria bacterium]
MIDHITIGVTNLDRSRNFYDRALKPLGIERLYADGDSYSGYGVRPKAFFWVGLRSEVQTGTHIAFAAPNRAAVHAFYDAAVAAGGRDNGKPGLRPQYRADYYGAFVLDPDGHNIEAVCYAPA